MSQFRALMVQIWIQISDKTLMQDKSDTSGKSKQEFIKIPYIIYNLDAHNHVYITKRELL